MLNTSRNWMVGLALCFLPAALATADVVHLRDGSTREGDVKRIAGGFRLTRADGTVDELTTEQVESIELKRTSGPATTQAASTAGAPAGSDAGKLASLRRSVDSLSDPKQAIERYERFIEQNKNTPLAVGAAVDMAVWTDRVDRGMTKVGSKWVTPEEHDALNAKALAGADEGRQLLKAGRLRDAEAALNKAIQEDPTNASAIYLRGVVTFRTDRIPAAKQNFEAVNASVSDHAPTLNNLGVILWRQNQFAAALNWYDQAMQSSPLDQAVLNNVAEALGALPENLRNGAIAQRVARRFTDQDTQLQQKLAPDGWYRWGATWVTQAQLDQMKAAEKEVNDKLDKLAGDFDVVQGRIRQIDLDIDSNNRTIRQLQSNQMARDVNGNMMRVPLPQVYYDLVNDNQKLAGQRTVELRRLDDLRATAARLKQQGPQPKFSGIQHLIGEEGAPVLLTKHDPTTRP